MALFGNNGGQGRSGIKLLPVLLFGIYGVYYYFSNQETVPVTGRIDQIVFPLKPGTLRNGANSGANRFDRLRVLPRGDDVLLPQNLPVDCKPKAASWSRLMSTNCVRPVTGTIS